MAETIVETTATTKGEAEGLPLPQTKNTTDAGASLVYSLKQIFQHSIAVSVVKGQFHVLAAF